MAIPKKPRQVFICQRCGKSFERLIFPSRKNKPTYCSKQCSSHAPLREFTCKTCGRIFTKKTFPSRNPPQFCSDKCQRNGIRPTFFICETCHKMFDVIMYPSTKRIPHFCSQECSIKAKAKPIMKCEVCGKEFISSKRRRKQSTLCSKECRAISQFKYDDETRKAIVDRYIEIGAADTSEEFGIPKWYIVMEAKRQGIKANGKRSKTLLTSLEKTLYKHLDDLGIEYQPQCLLGRYTVDALIAPNIIIEADGDYWHGHPHFEPLNARQRRQQGHDRARDTYFRDRGYITIRIWECEMSKQQLKQEIALALSHSF